MNALEQPTANASVAVRPKTFTQLQSEHRLAFNSEHGHVTANRPGSTERGYGYRWRLKREAFLKNNPLCVECAAEGRTELAVVVDHIIPHKGNRELFWNTYNWQSLCKRHHDIKTATKDGGFGR